jgi:hypothetical protein
MPAVIWGKGDFGIFSRKRLLSFAGSISLNSTGNFQPGIDEKALTFPHSTDRNI